MKDTRLQQAIALLDDARCLIVDIVDEGPSTDKTIRDFNNLDAARQFINSGIVYIQAAAGGSDDAA